MLTHVGRVPAKHTRMPPERRRALVVGILFLLVAVGLLHQAARVRFSLPHEPTADEDSWGYLNPAFSKLTGGTFEHTFGRHFAYPAFLFVWLCGWGHFSAVAVAQHALGVLSGVLFLAAWIELCALASSPAAPVAPGLVSQVGRPWWAPRAAWWPGLLPAAVYLLADRTVAAEHDLRPEAIFPCAAILSVWLNLRFIRGRFGIGRSPRAVVFGAANLFVTLLVCALKPSFGFAVPLVNLPLALVLCSRHESLRGRAMLLGPPLAAGFLLLWWPEHILKQHDRFSVVFLPRTLLSLHADIISDQLTADVESSRSTPYDPGWLRSFRDKFVQVYADSRTHQPWDHLGFNGDYPTYGDSVFDPFFPPTEEGDRRCAAFCYSYYLRTWRCQPWRMAAKVYRQMGVFYTGKPFAWSAWQRELRESFRRERILIKKPLGPFYRRTVDSFRYPSFFQRFQASVYGREYLDRCERLANGGRTRSSLRIVHLSVEVADALYLPVLCLAFGVTAAVLASGERGRRFRPLALAVTTLYLYNFGNCLTIAVVHWLGMLRYQFSQDVFTWFSEAAGLFFVVVAGKGLLTRPRTKGEAPRLSVESGGGVFAERAVN